MTPPVVPAYSSEELAENEAIEAELVSLLASGDAIAFVGAGYSATSGFPDWDTLLGRLATLAAGYDPLFAEDPSADNHHRAEAIRASICKSRGVEVWQGHINQIFGATPRLTQFHRDLVSLPFKAILTTNYDLTLEAALTEVIPVNPVTGAPPCGVPVFNGSKTRLSATVRSMVDGHPAADVIHLHGCVEHPASFVLASSEYKEAYGFDPWSTGQLPETGRHSLLVLLTSLLMTRRLVFIGFSHRDKYIADVVARIADTTWAWSQHVHFAIMGLNADNPDGDKQRAKELSNKLGIATLSYEVHNGDHSGGAALVGNLLDQVRLRRIVPAIQIASPSPLPAPAVVPPTPPWVAKVNKKALAKTAPNED